MTDRTLGNSDSSAQHQDPDKLNDQDEMTRVAPDVPGGDPVRFPSKSGDRSSDGVPTEIAEEVEQRKYGFGDESSGS